MLSDISQSQKDKPCRIPHEFPGDLRPRETENPWWGLGLGGGQEGGRGDGGRGKEGGGSASWEQPVWEDKQVLGMTVAPQTGHCAVRAEHITLVKAVYFTLSVFYYNFLKKGLPISQATGRELA